MTEAVRDERELTLSITLPKKIDPATLPSMASAIEEALAMMADAGLLERADRLAELATGLVAPSVKLMEERVARMRT